jgi:hypothetical protein
MIACYGCLCAAGLAAGAAFGADPPPVAEPGVWQKHEYSFAYMGFTSTYSCDGLADTLKRLLLASGARADAKAEPGACASPYGRPDRFARATLVFYTLVPAGTAGASGDPGQGAWQPVAIAPRSPMQLQVGDCEVVEQFRDLVLKKMFTTRNLVDHTTCVPHQESGSLIDLRFEAFAPVKGAMAAAAPVPAPPQLYVYPKQGQSAAQQAKDRSECQTSATAASGYDPAAPPTAGAPASGDAYSRALAACLEARGYSVR